MNKTIIKVFLVAIPLVASVPAMAQFQYTSTMTGSGSAYASDPMFGADGAATYSSAPNRGRTATMDCTHYDADYNSTCDWCGEECTKGQGVNSGTGGGSTDPQNQLPLGPALPALLLLAGAYAVVVALRRRQQA